MRKYNSELPTVIFDLDGTIVDNFEENLSIIYNQNKKKIDKIASFEDFIKTVHDNNLKDSFKKFKINIFEFLYRRFKSKKDIIKSADTSKLFSDMGFFFKENYRKYNFFILTSNFDGYLKKIIDKFDLKEYFVETKADKLLFSKSKKINKIVKKYKIDKKNCIYVGDEVRDFLASEKSNIKCISMTYGYNSKKLIEKYNHLICQDVYELDKKLEKIFYKNILKDMK